MERTHTAEGAAWKRAAAWVASAPPLLDPAPGWTAFRGLRPEVVEAVDGEALAERCAQVPARLGRRFEQVVQALLRADPDWEVVAAGVQVFAPDGSTAGEFDLVLRHLPTDRWVHVECACKLYLGDGRSRAHSRWHGTTLADTLEAKVQTLRRQTALSASPLGAATLAALGADRVTAEVLLLGWFFVPFRMLGGAALPKGAHRSVPTGWWCRRDEVADVAPDGGETRWLDLGGTAGLLGGVNFPGATPLEASAWRTSLVPGRPHWVAQLYPSDDGWIELSRGVVIA
jgi:hypothetical protein